MIQELATFEIYGNDFKDLERYYQNPFPDKEGSQTLCLHKESIKIPITLTNNFGIECEYELEIKGWIGSYKSTRGRKLGDKTDFPDNFILIFANKKLGEFNILPIIGKNRLNEVYIVGQIHVDLFEETELPDMALSNRQGYKSDDLRYQIMLDNVDKILKEALALRTVYSDFNKEKQNEIIMKAQRKKDEELNKAVKIYKESFKKSLSKNIKKYNNSIPDKIIDNVTDETINETIGLLGIKRDADKKRKKILLSQTINDKPLSDLIYDLLSYNNVPQEDILYSNSNNIESRLPLRTNIYDYLRSLFIDTYSEEKLYIIYVTSENMGKSWGCHMEAGAGWIIKNDYCLFNINDYTPLEPLKNGSQWHSSLINASSEISMNKGNVSICIDYITHICELLNYPSKTVQENEKFLSRRINII